MVQLAVLDKSNALIPPGDTPKIGWYVYLLSASALIGGFLFGYDTGIVSSAMLYVKDSPGIKPLSDLWQELIIAITSACASIGALLSAQCSDYFGRRKVIIFSSIVFTVGAFICAGAPNKEVLLVGRIFLGIGIGFSSMIVPVYVGEAAPMHIRGQLLTGFNFLCTFGQMFSNIVAGGLSYVDPERVGWRLMFGFAAIPAIIQFIAFLFLPESPRWLYAHQGESESRKVFKKVFGKNADWIDYHLTEIKAITEEEEKQKAIGEGGFVLWKILKTPHIRKAMLIGCSLQAFQQLAGINTIMYYAGTIIQAAGIKDDHKTIWISVGTSAMNTVGNVIPFWLIEKVGRKKILLCSAFGVIISLALMGTSFLLINLDSEKTLSSQNYATFDQNVKNFDHCMSHSNCDYCVTDEKCGFCVLQDQKTDGYCLPVNTDHSDKSSSTGFCDDAYSYRDNIHTYNTSVKFEWMDVYCKTKFTFLPIVIMVVYLSFFSFGFGPMPWVLNAEFYPLWARGTCVSLATFTNWIFNVVISLTFLSLTETVTKFGAFYIYAGITTVAFIVFWVFIPETKGCSIDEVEMLFMNDKEREKFKKNLENRLNMG